MYFKFHRLASRTLITELSNANGIPFHQQADSLPVTSNLSYHVCRWLGYSWACSSIILDVLPSRAMEWDWSCLCKWLQQSPLRTVTGVTNCLRNTNKAIYSSIWYIIHLNIVLFGCPVAYTCWCGLDSKDRPYSGRQMHSFVSTYFIFIVCIVFLCFNHFSRLAGFPSLLLQIQHQHCSYGSKLPW